MGIVMAIMIVGMLIGFGGFGNKIMGTHSDHNKQETVEKHQTEDSAGNMKTHEHNESNIENKFQENIK